MKNAIKDLVDFLKLVGKLKRTPRTGWITKVKVNEPESVADHSYRTSVLCMLFGDLKGVNANSMIRMALLHDLCESIIGDLPPDESGEKKRKENQAMIDALSLLPRKLSKAYYALWQEFMTGKTREARLVHELDKMEMAIQAIEYKKEGYGSKRLSEFLASAKAMISDDKISALFDGLNS